MDFPEHIESVLVSAGMKPATKAALYDLYASLGSAVLEKLADVADDFEAISEIEPEDVQRLKKRVIEDYVIANHARWLAGKATPSLWHPRALEGRASGLLLPMGEVGEEREGDDLGAVVAARVRAIVGADQPVPKGVLLFGKNAHYGGRLETVSFDVVSFDVDEALSCAIAAGQQHTAPGSVGETSGTFDGIHRALLIWETQPNVLKPSAERNQDVARLWRRHRNWHVATLTAAILWGFRQELTVFVLRGDALAPTHEVNAAKPVAEEIVQMHDRTVRRVVEGIGAELALPDERDSALVKRAELMNHGLTMHVAEHGVGAAMWRVRLTS